MNSASKSSGAGLPDDLLDCWKDIAVYLQRDVRTVMRWEHSRGLPVHRLPGTAKSSVFALKSELDLWRSGRNTDLSEDTDETCQDQLEHSKKLNPLQFWSAKEPVTSAVPFLGLIVAVVAVAVYLANTYRKPSGDPSPPIQSLAVLPFQNLNHDPGENYFADGVHEALITELARTSGLRVISHTSVMQYRETRMSARDIARDLNVDAVVEGSVLHDGTRIRITAQLVRGATDEHLWAESYDRDAGDVLRLTAEVSEAISREIRGSVAPALPIASPRSVSISPLALDSYLRAQYAFRSLTPEGLTAALELYRNTIALEPKFPHAWRGVAGTLAAQAFFGYESPSKVLPEARVAAERALSLDPKLGEAYGVLGSIALYWDRDFARAGEALKRAVELSPTSTMVRHQYADFLLVMGKTEESASQVRLGRTFDPHSWPASAVVLYHALMARHFDEVITEGRKLVNLAPTRPELHEWVGRALWLEGKQAEAIEEWKLAFPANDRRYRKVQETYRRAGARAALQARAELAASMYFQHRESALDVASWFAEAGDADGALTWLKRSYTRSEPLLLHVAADPYFDPIRPDPRFQRFLRQLGIQPTLPQSS